MHQSHQKRVTAHQRVSAAPSLTCTDRVSRRLHRDSRSPALGYGAPVTDTANAVANRIKDIIEAPKASELVAAYFDPASPFSGATFDSVGTNDLFTFSVDDLLALTMLDVGLKPLAVREVLGHGQATLSELLRAVPHEQDLWEATDETLDAATRLFAELDALPAVGAVNAGKLMARKRPRLIPVIDKHVITALQAPKGKYWATMRDALGRGKLWLQIEQTLRVSAPASVTTLRLLDVAIWMRLSEADSARLVRSQLGLPVTPRENRSVP